ncbi:MAG: YdeI/OmpD-associated family protein [Anaerolineae bacterium]|jgi:bifunctional DNA-binding transcriptional regulator/antitoxin component of YhaV-PrlF toxin-antitoxin module|nr:YdeI/OmpD-associated family protein [Anaerolineae bacterium]
MKFRTTLRLEGKTATGIEAPADVVAALGKGKRPPVYVTINGYTYRSTVAAYGDLFMLPVSAEVRERAGVAAGDEVEVELTLDEDRRAVAVPDDLAQALAAAPEAKRFFDGLSYSHQRRYVLSVEDAKTPETRARRVEKTVSALLEGRKTG